MLIILNSIGKINVKFGGEQIIFCQSSALWPWFCKRYFSLKLQIAGTLYQWRSEGILRPGANKNFAPPVFYNSMIICTSRFVLSSYIGRLSFCIATTFKIFFRKFSRFIQKHFKLGSPFSTLSSTLFFWHNLPTS